MVTTLNEGGVTDEAMRGAAGYIVKPFSLGEVRAKVDPMLTNKYLDGNTLQRNKVATTRAGVQELGESAAHESSSPFSGMDIASRSSPEQIVDAAPRLASPESEATERIRWRASLFNSV